MAEIKEQKVTILVVNDQPGKLKTLLSFLESHHFHVRVANSGKRALLALNEQPADIILLDVMMPEMDGFETCRRIKENRTFADIPVIFMTSQDSVADKVTAFAAGGVDYIVKPFQQPEVLARINTHVTLRRKALQLEQALAVVTRQKKQLEKLSQIDDLTGLFNRRQLNIILKQEFERCKRHKSDLSCLMLDLDNFKNINDTYGHEYGDTVLREFAARIKESLRSSDIPFRFGGEEVLILLPQTDIKGAAQVAEKIRLHMEREAVRENDISATVLVSIGAASFCHNHPTVQNDLIAFADRALYQAKDKGRNRVQIQDKEERRKIPSNTIHESETGI